MAPETTKRRSFRSRMFGTEMHESIFGVQEWNLDIRQFAIYLTGEAINYNSDGGDGHEEPGVEYQMSSRLIKNLHILSDIDPKRPILVHMKTNGGDWAEGMAIHDAIKFSPNPIVILNYTHARSMSSIIFQAADRRVMMPNSNFMFHEGTLGNSDTYKGFMSFAEWAKRDTLTMLEIYAAPMKRRGRFSRRSMENIKAILQNEMDKKQERYLTAQETVEWGLADYVFEGDWQKLRHRLKKQSLN